MVFNHAMRASRIFLLERPLHQWYHYVIISNKKASNSNFQILLNKIFPLYKKNAYRLLAANLHLENLCSVKNEPFRMFSAVRRHIPQAIQGWPYHEHNGSATAKISESSFMCLLYAAASYPFLLRWLFGWAWISRSGNFMWPGYAGAGNCYCPKIGHG